MLTKQGITSHTTKEQGVDISDFNFTQDSVRLVPNSPLINQYRQNAFQAFCRLPIPDIKQEPWRRTDLRILKPELFSLPSNDELASSFSTRNISADQKNEFASTIQVSPQESIISLDSNMEESGVIFTDLRTAESKYPALLEKYLGKAIDPTKEKFSALSAAFAENGILLYVPKNVNLEKPLQGILSLSDADISFVSHVLIILEQGASATYFQEYKSNSKDKPRFHSGLVEILLAEQAKLNFVEVQSWDSNMFNFTHERIQVSKNANLDWIIGALGSRLTKSFMDLDLVGVGATGKVSGFSFTNNNQHLDYDTQQNHYVPGTTSDLFYKVALTDESHSVWQGMIYVAPGAEKADGYQANRNLILSSNAHADSIPGLEILADDVRCTHGATVGDLDFDQIYYLMTRCIPRKEAETILVEGFFDPIMQRIPFESVRSRFTKVIHHKLMH